MVNSHHQLLLLNSDSTWLYLFSFLIITYHRAVIVEEKTSIIKAMYFIEELLSNYKCEHGFFSTYFSVRICHQNTCLYEIYSKLIVDFISVL